MPKTVCTTLVSVKLVQVLMDFVSAKITVVYDLLDSQGLTVTRKERTYWHTLPEGLVLDTWRQLPAARIPEIVALRDDILADLQDEVTEET